MRRSERRPSRIQRDADEDLKTVVFQTRWEQIENQRKKVLDDILGCLL